MTYIESLFWNLFQYWFVDSDIVSEWVEDITEDIIKILWKYNLKTTQAKYISREFLDRNYIQEEELDGLHWFILGFLLFYMNDEISK